VVPLVRAAVLAAVLAGVLLMGACADPLAPERITVHLRNEDTQRRDVYIMVGDDVTPSPEDLVTHAAGVRRVQLANESPISRFFRATPGAGQALSLAICATAGNFSTADPGLHVVWNGSSLVCQGWSP
jgi:hypothetical protein